MRTLLGAEDFVEEKADEEVKGIFVQHVMCCSLEFGEFLRIQN